MVICRAAVPDKEREASAELADDFGMDEQMSPLAGRQNIEFTNRQLVSLILPMMAEQLLGITVGLADSLMVATVGDASISAVSLVDSVSALMIYIFSAMATGGAVVAGQYLGRREREEACRSAQQLMVLLGVVSLAVTALLYLFRDLIVTRLFGHIDADVMEATNIYYSYVMASIPGIALYNGGAALFRTMSRSDVSLKVSLLMNGINVAGNAILIFGLGFDVAGVAIPTLVSRTVAAVVIVWLLFNEKLELHLSDIRASALKSASCATSSASPSPAAWRTGCSTSDGSSSSASSLPLVRRASRPTPSAIRWAISMCLPGRPSAWA